MEPRPEAGLPATLGRWVGEIVLSIPATGTAHGRGTHRGRVAGRRWARHAGVPSPDASPGLAGVPLDARARSVPAAGLGCRAVRHRPAREPWGTVLRPHRRHARAPCIGQGAGSGRALRPCPQAEPPRLPAVPGLCHAAHRRGLSRSAALRADRHRPVPRSWPRREDRVGQGLAAGRGRSPRTAEPAAGRLVYARLADPGGPAARARRRRPGPARHGAVQPAAALRSGPAWPPEGVWREDRRRGRGPPADLDAPHRRLRRPGSPSAPRRVPSAVPARRRRAGGLVRVGQAPGRLGEAAPAALHGPGPVRAGGGRGLRAALGGGAPIRRAQADGRHGRDVAAGPPNAPALAAPGPDRPRTACPADRAGGAGGARASAGRWLAQAGDADAGPGQGRACPAVPRYPGFPPRAHNPQENRPCSWYRTARERRRRMTSGSNPRPPPYRSRKRRDQTRTAGAAAPRKLETRVISINNLLTLTRLRMKENRGLLSKR